MKEDFLSGLSANRQHIIALLFILILPFFLYDEVTIGGKKFMGHDTIQWRAGAESIIEYRKANGEEPLWASNMFSGMPAYVISVQKSVPHLDTLIRTLSNSIFPAVHYWIMLGGVYFLLVLMGIRPFSSLVGAILIGFTTYIPIILGVGHNGKFIAYSFIPWVLVGYWLISRTNKKLLSFALLSVALTLEFRAGHPQVTYYFLYLLGFWWLYDTYRAYRNNQLTAWMSTTGLVALAGVLGFLGNAQQYWRFMEYSDYSIRGGSALSAGSGGLALDYAFRWSQGFGELMTLIIPGIFGGSSSEAYWGPKPVTSGPHYLGAVAFILVLFALFRSRRQLKYLFLGVGCLTIVFSLGRHFETFNRLMFNYVPYFDKFRTPEMWLIVTVFCFSILAVFGLEALVELAKSKKKELTPLLVPVTVSVGLGLIFALGSDALLSYEKPGERQQYAQQVARQNNVSPTDPRVEQTVSNFINTRLKPQRKEMAKKDSIRYFIIALLVSGLIIGFYKEKISLGYFLVALILITSYDMISVGNRYTNVENLVSGNRNAEQVILSQKRPLDEYLEQHVNSGDGWPYRVFPLGDNPFNNAVPSYFYPTVGGYTGAKLSYYQDLIDQLLFTAEGRLNIPVLSMLNVRYISYNQELPFPELQQVYNGDDGFVFENLEVLPKVFYIDSIQTVSTPREAISAMQPDSGFNPAETAVVEGNPGMDPVSDTTAAIEITSYDARAIEMKSRRSNDGFAVLSEIYYPEGWELTVDGNPAEIFKTNYVLRGFVVPAGEHTIRMEFNPKSYVMGTKVAWGSNLLQWVIGIVALAYWGRSYKKKDPVSE